jgi:hypothetical protein
MPGSGPGFSRSRISTEFIRYDHVPSTLAEWRSLPETYLATATNGRVFADPLGEFTAFRDGSLHSIHKTYG